MLANTKEQKYNNPMTYQELVNYLFETKDDNFAVFSKRLLNSTLNVIGVKTPVLRKLIKEHYSDIDLKLEDFEHGQYVEIESIYFGVGLLRCKDIDEQLKFMEDNIKYASSWAITDTVTVYFKKCSYEKFWEFFLKNNNSEQTYLRRFSYVFGLKFSNDKRILETFNYIKENEEYMVMMAEAWLLSFVAVYFPKEVYDYLKNSNDVSLKRKAISKIADSYRFEEEIKNKFKSLRP